MEASDITKLNMDEARAALSERVDAAYHHGQPTILMRYNNPRAVIVNYEWFTQPDVIAAYGRYQQQRQER